jgi:hypothetical protein
MMDGAVVREIQIARGKRFASPGARYLGLEIIERGLAAQIELVDEDR